MKAGVLSAPILSCPGCVDGVHLCPYCWYNRACNPFVDTELYDFKVCSTCASKEPTSQPTWNIEVRLREAIGEALRKDDKAGTLKLDKEELEEISNQLWDELQPYILDKSTVMDGLIDQNLNTSLDVRRNWSGSRLHPQRPSLDAFCAVVRGKDNKTMYHFPGNVHIISDSVNRLMKNHPKYLLHVICGMVAATTYEDYEAGHAVFGDSLINHYELGVLGSNRTSVRLGLACDSFQNDFKSITEAMLDGEPLPRTVSREKILRTTVRSSPVPFNIDLQAYKFPDFEYMMREIDRAAQITGLTSQQHRAAWSRNGVFCPFAINSEFVRWTHWDCFNFFSEKLERMSNHCDHLYKNQANRPDCTVQELMVTVAYLHMWKVAQDLKEGRDIRLCGRDEAGLLLYPTIQWMLASSLGHDDHGKQMLTGMKGFDLGNETECEFDPEICNICWETQGCNNFKWAYHKEYYPQLFGQLKKLRVSPAPGATLCLPSAAEIFTTRRNQLSVLVTRKDNDDEVR